MNQPLAYVHPGAKISKNVVIEPFTTINNNVIIGDGTWIGFHFPGFESHSLCVQPLCFANGSNKSNLKRALLWGFNTKGNSRSR